MQTQFSDASGVQDAPEKYGRSMFRIDALQPTFKQLKTGVKFSLFAFALAFVTTSCVKGDDEPCGGELDPCENIVTDDISDG